VLRALVLPLDPTVLLAERAVWSRWLENVASDADAMVLTAAIETAEPGRPVVDPDMVAIAESESSRASDVEGDPCRAGLTIALDIADASGLVVEQHGQGELETWVAVLARIAALAVDERRSVAPWFSRWRSVPADLRPATIVAARIALATLSPTAVELALWQSILRLQASQTTTVGVVGNGELIVSQLRGPSLEHARARFDAAVEHARARWANWVAAQQEAHERMAEVHALARQQSETYSTEMAEDAEWDLAERIAASLDAQLDASTHVIPAGEWNELVDLRSPDVPAALWGAECVPYRLRVTRNALLSIADGNPALTFAYWLDRRNGSRLVRKWHPEMPPVWIRAIGADLGASPVFRGELFICSDAYLPESIDRLP
jgi:hypothetical protein